MRFTKYMCTERLVLIMKAFIEAQFNYCPLVWMFHSKKLQKRLDKLHERALRVLYKDDISSFEDLLKKDKSFNLHDRNQNQAEISGINVSSQ